MSTELHLRCVSHEPYIESGMVGVEAQDLHRVRVDLRQRDSLVRLYNSVPIPYDALPGDQVNTIRFLVAHPNCELEIWDEYGHKHPNVEITPEPQTVEDFILARIKDFEMEFYRQANMSPEFRQHMKDTFRIMRDIVDFHRKWPVLVEGKTTMSYHDQLELPIDQVRYSISQQMQWLTQEQYRKQFGTEPPTAPFLKRMAEMWQDHPHFNQDWIR